MLKMKLVHLWILVLEIVSGQTRQAFIDTGQSILIGYANNIFGISYRMQSLSLNQSIVSLKGRPFRMPNVSNIRFNETQDVGLQYLVEPRSKRGVINLYNMISCATGCRPLSYKGYGCYCGFMGSGYAIDSIDECCQIHDSCYGLAKCPLWFMEYVVPYFWKCVYNKPQCAIDHDIFGGPNSCASKLCECDRQLSLCLQRHSCPQSRPFCTSSPFRLFQNAIMMFV